VSQSKHTARFVCTNDSSMAQIASFYAGAMSEARDIELAPIVDRVGGATYVLVGPNDPEGMVRHTNECRRRGYPFIADPSQQLAFGDGDMIKELIDGAAILFSNEYESALIEKKTGWTHDEILERVGTWVVTLGAQGVRVERNGEEPIVVAAVPEIEKVEPTGVGDAFRAGFLAALEWDLSLERAAQLGCLLAVFVVEKVGTQEYTLHQRQFVERFAAAYGDEAAAEIAAHVRTPRP
jgi:adenosine kinase